jgi:hypothetical protein
MGRRAHAFHRHAHHPLCGAYAGEIVRVGRRTLLCRGCLLAGAGAAAGALGALFAPLPPLAALALALAAAALAVPAAVAPPRAGPRSTKLLTRAAPSAVAAAFATLGLRHGSAGGAAVALAVLAIVFAATLLYRRRGPDRTPCRACAERATPRVCSGYRRMARREAAFSRLAGRLLRSDPVLLPPAPPISGVGSSGLPRHRYPATR